MQQLVPLCDFASTALTEFPVTELILPVPKLRARVDTADLPIVLSHATRWRASWDNDSQTYYVKSCKDVLLHRLVTHPSPRQTVDHGDHDGLNNRRHNLRAVPHAINMLNRRAVRAKSGYRGVVVRPTGKWRASVMRDHKRVLLGDFTDPKEASAAVEKFLAEVTR